MASEQPQLSRIPPGTHGFDPDFVANHQRRRILRATAEVVVEDGYRAATITRILRAARVSPSTFYAAFADKEAAFLAAFDRATALAAERIEAAYAAEQGWPRQVRAAIAAFLQGVAADPTLARLCLVESLNAGPAANARYRTELARYDALLIPGRALSPRGAGLPETVEPSLISGIVWAAYQQLTTGHLDNLPQLVDELLGFVLDHYLGFGTPEAAAAIDQMRAPSAPAPESGHADGERRA